MSDQAGAQGQAATDGGAAANAGSALLGGSGGGQQQTTTTTPTNGAAPAATAATNGAAQNGNSAPWYSSFMNGLDEPVANQWKSFAGRYTSPQEFVKGHVELRNNAIFLPKEPKPEDLDNVYTRLGMPKDAKEYQFTDPQDVPLDDSEKEFRESFRQVARRARLTQAQVKEIEAWNLEHRKTVYDAESTKPKVHYERAVQSLKKEWGMDFERNVNLANNGVRYYGKDEWNALKDMKLADGSFVGDRPEFARIWARIGNDLSEDGRAVGMSQAEIQGIDDQIKSLQEKAKAEGKMPWQEPYHSQIESLMRKKPGMSKKRSGGAFGA